ncbi:MAG TPA: hypothetical protein DCQ31_00700, partial [Bacteroidales bacterium]|nr:hypothetical protein [Bacteroidales bacterium]
MFYYFKQLNLTIINNTKLMKKIVIVVFLLLIAILTQAQSREISGKITDELGNPIAGATVQVKGAELIARSDANGWYKIQVPLNASTLTFSYSGKKTSDIQISQTNAIDIVLSPENDDIFDLSLEQLLEIKISTASKKEERIADIPASVVILTRKEIEIYGFTNLEEIFTHITGLYYSNNESFLGPTLGVRGYMTANPTNIV